MNWINVNEKLPEDETDVFIWTGRPEVGCYYSDSKEWVIYSDEGENNKVTHWAVAEPPTQ